MTTRTQPNIIVFFTDQQRHDTTGAAGSTLDLTPNFDRMASEGTHVANSFTCQPVCGPARSCLQTGLYATQTGVWNNGFALKDGQRTLAHHFNDAGYDTGYIGKWHLMPHDFHGPVPREAQGGYQTWLGANLLELVSDAYDCRLWDEDGNEHRLPGYRVDGQTDAAIRYISSERENPYFLFLSYIEPHHQNHSDNYPAPEGYEQRYAGARLPPDLAKLGGSAPQHWPGYCGMIKRLDEALGRLFDALKSLDQLDNTIVLFTSDHGNHFKTRNSEYKRSCHEASIHVPTAVCGPGFNGGGRIQKLVSLVDLPPTLLDAAGIEVPAEMAGRSVLPLLGGGDRPDWPEEVFVQISESHTGRCVRTARWKYSVRCPEVTEDGNPVSRRDADFYEDDFLYDLQADPWEQTNLIGMSNFRDVVADLRRRLVARMTSIGEKEPRFLDAPEKGARQRKQTYHGGSTVG
ncbi:MAG: arylsulfatase [Verrucomicrobia bacterium]|nr:MAG: arylsulfatase [Verrucomicrobiota bacterium]